jgi:hypothetical protein
VIPERAIVAVARQFRLPGGIKGKVASRVDGARYPATDLLANVASIPMTSPSWRSITTWISRCRLSR